MNMTAQEMTLELTVLEGRLLDAEIIQHLGPAHAALKAAKAALEAQIPRVLSLDEVVQFFEQNKPVLLQKKHFRGGQWYGNGEQVAEEMFLELGKRGMDEEYNHEWRCWNVMPTAEQMAATPWDGKQEG